MPAGVDVTTVHVSAAGGPSYQNTRVSSNGQFSLTSLEPGQYKLYFYEMAQPAQLIQTYYGSRDYNKSTTVTVSGGGVSGISQSLQLGGVVAGTVSVPVGVDATKITASASSPSGSGSSNLLADGSFAVRALPTGTYKVEFRYDNSQPSPVIGTWYGGVPTSATATPIDVVEGGTVSGIDQTLKPAGIISGNIVVPQGSDPFLFNIKVVKGPDFGAGAAAGYGSTKWGEQTGSYAIGGLEPGTYKLEFSTGGWSPWAKMWHGGVGMHANSPTVTVAAGQHVSGLQDKVVAGGTISGSVNSGNYQYLTAIAEDGSVAAEAFLADTSTSYGLSGLFPGSYKVQFNRSSGYQTLLEGQLYKSIPESSGAANATPVTVKAGQTVPNINATVRLGGTLSGRLVGSSGSAIGGSLVSVFTKDGSFVTRAAFTAADGTFKVTGLTTGLYFVSAEPAGESGPIYSGNVLTEANARSVSSFVGQNTDLGTLSYATATQGTRGFDDVPLGAQFQNEILWLANEGISTGWEANGSRTYQPLTPVNRDAMAAFMYRLSGEPEFTPPAVSPFADLPTDAKFYKEITWLADKGISTGWEAADETRTYRPLQPVNRDAMAAFMYRLAEQPEFTAPATSPFFDVPVGAQFYKEITWLAAQGISTGWTESAGKSFKPLLPVNRDAMAAFMFRFDAKLGAI